MYCRLKISERIYKSVFDDISNDRSAWEEDNPFENGTRKVINYSLPIGFS
jgi:hypothetical protein